MRNLDTPEERTRSGTRGFSATIRKGHPQRSVFLSMGPVALCVTSVLLMGLMAVLYLGQVAQGVDTNHQLQQLRLQQSSLTRQNQDLAEQLAKEQSPGYIRQHALQQGLQPADPKDVHTIVVPNLQPIPSP